MLVFCFIQLLIGEGRRGFESRQQLFHAEQTASITVERDFQQYLVYSRLDLDSKGSLRKTFSYYGKTYLPSLKTRVQAVRVLQNDTSSH